MEELRDGPPFKKSIKVLVDSSSTILAAGERVATIVGSLKNFARLDEAEYQKVDVHEGIESTLTLIQNVIKDGTEIIKEFGTIPKVYCNPSEVNQIFMTMLTNAAQAIDTKGEIRIKTTHEGDEVVIAISDTGKGIEEERLQTLFDLNFTNKGSRVGFGLGLPTAYDIVQRHEGELKVESEVGKGTVFEIRLPAK